MTLPPGSSVGPYEILASLGAGGMGEVYRAKDTRLGRDVAIKVLPEAMARDADRVARFEREAKVLASLNHPNIGAIHSFESAGARKLLVLEFVEGQTLALLLKAGAMPLEEVLNVSRQVAEALEVAHEKGVVHRDLKPGNVMVRPDGMVKVLDFGLARAMTEDSSSAGAPPDSPTVTSPAHPASPTMPGVIMGTAGYMSPEQARGKPVDKRSDIFSFGCVLYEMVSGAPPFGGETVADSLGATLHREPDWGSLPPDTPPAIPLLLRRCLAKDRNRRLRDIGDARIEIEYAIADPTSTMPGVVAPAIDGDVLRRRLTGISVLLAVGAMLLVGSLGFYAGRNATPAQMPIVRKYEIALKSPNTWAIGQPAVSPDGTMIAYSDRDRLWLHRRDAFDAQEIADTDHGSIPFWSPDNLWLGFAQGDKLLKVSVNGGRPSVIAKGPGVMSPVGGACWTRDGRIYFSTGDTGILEVSASGGPPRMVVAPEFEDDDDFHELTLLPDGRSIVFCVHSRTRPWYLASWDGRERRIVLQAEQHLRSPAYSPTGHILFEQFGNEVSVWALPFSVEQMAPTGAPFLVAAGDGDPSVSETGALALTRNTSGLEGAEVVSVNLVSKTVEPILQAGGIVYDPVLSPDGSTVALTALKSGVNDLWLMDIHKGTRTRLTFDESRNEVLSKWSPDGRVVAVSGTSTSTFERMAQNDAILFLNADGSGEAREQISGGCPTFDRDWTYLAFVRIEAETGGDVFYLALNENTAPLPMLQTSASEKHPALSPDGRWLAYTSDESGSDQIYLTRFPSAQGKWQVSAGYGNHARWSKNGTQLFYVDSTATINEVQLTTEPRIMLSQPRVAVDGASLGINAYQGYDVGADDQSLIAVRAGRGGQTAVIGVIENWYEEFKNRP